MKVEREKVREVTAARIFGRKPMDFLLAILLCVYSVSYATP